MNVSVSVEVEGWDQVWPECEPLMQQQANEVYGARAKPLVVDYEMARRLEIAGGLLIFAARDVGRLVGYLFWIASPDLESVGRKIATAGPWYVLPKYRAGGVGARLMLQSEMELAKRGFGEIHAHAPIKNGEATMLGRWFATNGWQLRQIQYMKELGNEKQHTRCRSD